MQKGDTNEKIFCFFPIRHYADYLSVGLCFQRFACTKRNFSRFVESRTAIP